MDLRLPLVLAITCLCLSCDEPGPATKTQAEFIEAYRSAYNARDRTAVYKLAKWDGVPNDLRSDCERLLTFWIGEHQITSIEMVPYEIDPAVPVDIGGRKVEATLTPSYWLIAKLEGHAGYDNSKSTGSIKCAVGIDNGVLRFCGIRWAE